MPAPDIGLDLDLEKLAPERVRPIKRSEYDRMVEMGLFEGERVELLRGVLVQMTPQGTPHAVAIQRLNHLLVVALDGRAWVRPQLPFAIGDHSEPEPDLAVVPLGDYLPDHPSDALLAIEVSESSLSKDRHIKAALYAEAGVREYWLVNLVDDVIEVYADITAGTYTRTTRYGPGDAITLSAFPDVAITVDDVLPGASSPIG